MLKRKYREYSHQEFGPTFSLSGSLSKPKSITNPFKTTRSKLLEKNYEVFSKSLYCCGYCCTRCPYFMYCFLSQFLPVSPCYSVDPVLPVLILHVSYDLF